MFNESFRELRKEKKITQIELAKIFNVSHGTIANWETGNREPDIKTLTKIADYFNVSIDKLFGREKENTSIDIGLNLSDREKQIIELYKKCNPNDQNIIYGYIQAKTERSDNLSKFANGKKW